MRVLFLCAHADDAEFCCGNTEVLLAKEGHELIIACMTGDEYGTKRDEFKGERISKIRVKEMERAAEILGAQLDWLGFIDGYLPFNQKSFNTLKNYVIKKIKPDIVFAPEPLFTLDFHTDHVITGKLIYLVLKQMKNPPPLLYFHTFKPNYSIPCKHRTESLDILSSHVSQGMARKLTHRAQRIYQFFYGWRARSLFGEGYRLIRFKPGESSFSPYRRLLYWLSKAFNNLTLPDRDFYKPTPKELGLI